METMMSESLGIVTGSSTLQNTEQPNIQSFLLLLLELGHDLWATTDEILQLAREVGDRRRWHNNGDGTVSADIDIANAVEPLPITDGLQRSPLPIPNAVEK
ncbi:hypothetical protein GUJ93_ZPchr0008g13622 [Zizania palustris]|uniref:Uncharacterized protein n=1 Tax=Zizania palustris TaxID=103762 RepID=A0A8J5RIF0_ZIZPA|nr:hypothetical protein GUJ93_ZPchr0008g13622 [Zizania palustris]